LISYCPQTGGAFSDLTTKDNLKAISEIVINDKALRDGRVDYLLSKFELENVKDIKAKHLSGGQRRKLVVALALLRKPKILLLDEPYSAMDVISVRMLQEIIVNLQHEEQITVLVTDHQAKELLSVTDSAMILSNAKIIAQDTPNNLLKHQEAIRSYFGSSFKLNS
jgi:lipopolysaccharide export system ATP-binding protein